MAFELKNEDCEDIEHARLIFGEVKKDRRISRS
jgi:hypothetical protein